jgi:catechol 2,3-dioxygenase-like lactoylglutathione lyase family enzyme
MRVLAVVALPCVLWAEQLRFHHVHLNTVDRKAALQFYAARLEPEARLWFTTVASPPKSAITSAIWHIGWGGGPDMRLTYQKQLKMGTRFQTPLTDISDQCDGKGGNGRFLFAYIDGPDHALIELNTTAAGNTGFGHIHLLSEDPIAAGEWYVRELGLARRNPAPPSREPRYRCGRQTGPSVSLMMDGVNLIVYPAGNAKAAFPEVWKGRTALESSEGHAIDHLGFVTPKLDATLARLRKNGVKVTGRPRTVEGGKFRSAFIEGPDRIRIELLEAVY